MKSKWRVSTDCAAGEIFIHVSRLLDISKSDCSENRELYPESFNSEDEAKAKAEELNRNEE